MSSTTQTPHPTAGIIYSSTAPFSFAHFMRRLHDPSLSPIAPHIRVLSFHLPHDTMAASGIINWLSMNDPDPPPRERFPPTLAIASDMIHSLLDSHHAPATVPTRKWFQVLIHLVRCCANVETVEVPAEWGDVRWYEGVFPLIDPATKRQLGSGRWRWGKDWGVEGVEGVYREAYMEQRSLGME